MTDLTDTELRDQLRAAVTALGKAETELASLRSVARGYCPACGRGDCAPTVADWEQQRQRADKAEEFSRWALAQRQEMAEERYAWQERGDRAEARVADYEQRLTWHTTCAACAHTLATGIRETDRADRAEAALGRVRGLHCKASDGDTCVYCAYAQRPGHGTGWPCDTIRVLNGGRPSGPAATQATHPTGTDPKETTP